MAGPARLTFSVAGLGVGPFPDFWALEGFALFPGVGDAGESLENPSWVSASALAGIVLLIIALSSCSRTLGTKGWVDRQWGRGCPSAAQAKSPIFRVEPGVLRGGFQISPRRRELVDDLRVVISSLHIL